jgi:lysozyme
LRRMKLPPQGIALIESSEKLELVPYQDSVRIWTCGWGAIRGLDGSRFTAASAPITRPQACFLLTRDSKIAADAIRRCVTRQLSGNRRGAIGSWVFNLGESNLRISTLLRMINKGNESRVADEWKRWNRAGGRVLEGLIARRARELALWKEGL